MIMVNHFELFGVEAAIRGMRNPLESWDRSDSFYGCDIGGEESTKCADCTMYRYETLDCPDRNTSYILGESDRDLMIKLTKAGSDERKFLRMVHIQMDITAPLYWWKEYDTYKVATTANSTSTMHKLHSRDLTVDDFSIEDLSDEGLTKEEMGILLNEPFQLDTIMTVSAHKSPKDYVIDTIGMINTLRRLFVVTKDKKYWRQMIQMLPSTYNQTRTVDFSFETLRNMYQARKNHKLSEWREFCEIARDSIGDLDQFLD